MLKDKIRNREKTVGMYIQLTDISISRIAGLAGYDFVWVDTEHSYMTTETVMAHLMALKSTNTPIVVRLPQNDLTATKRIIEMGVDGVIFPMIRTTEEAEKAIAKTLYPPYGERGFGPMNAINYGLSDVIDYIKNDHNRLCRFIQIEHKDAVENLDKIMENQYIDGYIFGPNDLAGSINMLGYPFSDEVTEVMKGAIDKLHKNNKYTGIASGGYADEIVKHWNSFGTHMLCAGADFDFLRDGMVNNLKNLRKIHC